MSAEESGRLGVIVIGAALIVTVGGLVLYAGRDGASTERAVAPKKLPAAKARPRAGGVEARSYDPAAPAPGEAKGPDDPTLRKLDEARSRDLKYYGFTPEELFELAKTCDVRTDIPGELTAEHVEQMGLSEREKAAYDEALAALDAGYREQLEQLYRESGGDEDALADMSVGELGAKLAKLTRHKRDTTRQAVAEERAGLREPPADLDAEPIESRWFRLRVSRGDAMEDALAKRLGRPRARQLRAKLGGWPGGQLRHWQCPQR